MDDSCLDDYHADMTRVKSFSRLRGRAPDAAARRFDSLEQEAYLNLWRTYDRLKAFEEEVFASFDLSAQQYNALRLLRDAAPESLPTLTLAARLVVRERQTQNRRVVRIALTPAGERLLSQMAARVAECGARQLGHLSAVDLRTLIGLLKEARLPHEVPLADRVTAPTPLPE